MFTNTDITFSLDVKICFNRHIITIRVGQEGGGGAGVGGECSGIPVYPKKIRQNTQKYPKFIQIYPKLMEALYTVYLEFKESDIPNTHI